MVFTDTISPAIASYFRLNKNLKNVLSVDHLWSYFSSRQLAKKAFDFINKKQNKAQNKEKIMCTSCMAL
jgi:hypothetical protein